MPRYPMRYSIVVVGVGVDYPTSVSEREREGENYPAWPHYYLAFPNCPASYPASKHAVYVTCHSKLLIIDMLQTL